MILPHLLNGYGQSVYLSSIIFLLSFKGNWYLLKLRLRYYHRVKVAR